VIVFRPIEELTVRRVHLRVILRVLHCKVRNPAQLSIDISFLGKFGVVGHARSLDFVFFIWIQLPLRLEHNCIVFLVVFAKVLL